MSSKEDQFLSSLRATFKVEADEHLQAIGSGLIELEKSPSPDERRRIIGIVFRAAHSLKGAARAVSFNEIETVCQSLEDMFAAWKRQDITPSPQALDRALRSLDAVTRILVPSTGQPSVAASPSPPPAFPPAQPLPPSPSPAPPHVEAPKPAPSVSEPVVSEKHGAGETVRIAVAKLDARLLEAEELLTAKLTGGQRAADLREVVTLFDDWNKEWAVVHPDVRALRQTIDRTDAGPRAAALPGLNRLAEFFEWNHDYLRSLEGKITALSRTALHDHLAVSKLVDDLLADSKRLLMLPLGTLGGLFPKIVRDICRDQGKEADLVIRGEEVEIDKRILEEMKDPLIHLLRNCVDHGIETPELRVRLGKPPRATITLEVSPVNGSKVEFLISDDGGGIDVAKVKEAAVRHGHLTREEAGRIAEAEALMLIFKPDLSTSPMITQLSGRGLGLAIVQEKTEKLGGSVSVESRPNAGTAFRIRLPVALATFRGVLVEAAGRIFVVPTAQVERVGRFKAEEVRTVEGCATLSLNGRAVALVRLAEVLDLPAAQRKSGSSESAATPVILLGTGDQCVAFAVDAVINEQEVLVKRLGKPLSRVRNVAGATVLGSGQVAPILNVGDLLKSAKKQGGTTRMVVAAGPVEAVAKSILVAEDSITSRMLIRGILESAGYRVKTVVDGMEAFTTLRSERFDLVVSDVEMPRMNGFDLTARIRADRKLAELPVILVTALSTREDREHGIDVGANAYLVKGSLDQSNLIEAVRRLA